MEISLTRGLVAFIDKEDFPLIAGRKWQAAPRRDGKGHYATAKGGLRMHRVLLGVTDSRIVDHIDGDGLNNRRNNLRAGTQSQNCINRKTTGGKNLRGTYKKGNRWFAYVSCGGKIKALGGFATEIEAHAAHVKALKELYGEWAPSCLELPELPSEVVSNHQEMSGEQG